MNNNLFNNPNKNLQKIIFTHKLLNLHKPNYLTPTFSSISKRTSNYIHKPTLIDYINNFYNKPKPKLRCYNFNDEDNNDYYDHFNINHNESLDFYNHFH